VIENSITATFGNAALHPFDIIDISTC